MLGRKKALPVDRRLVFDGEAEVVSRSSSPIPAPARPTPSRHLMRTSRSSSPRAPARPTKSRNAAVKKAVTGVHETLERSMGTCATREAVLSTPQRHIGPAPARARASSSPAHHRAQRTLTRTYSHANSSMHARAGSPDTASRRSGEKERAGLCVTSNSIVVAPDDGSVGQDLVCERACVCACMRARTCVHTCSIVVWVRK